MAYHNHRLAPGLRRARVVSCLALACLLLTSCSEPTAPAASEATDDDVDDDESDGAEPDAGRDAAPEQRPDAAARDAGVNDAGARRADAAVPRPDAGSSGAGSGCMLGEAGSFATDESLDLFGQITYFAKSTSLPAGRYRVSYVDGCMKYNAILPWTVNQSSPPSGWWLVGASNSDKVTLLPGVVSSDFFGTFESCVSASKSMPGVEFDFAGGKLGLWLDDAPYQDNAAGVDGRNPKWQLTLLVEECPPDLVLL